MPDDPLDDPASLWPPGPVPPAGAPDPQPRRWVWDDMEPPERQDRLRELARWVGWLRLTFEQHNQLPDCWYRHKPVREIMTALYVGWVRTYAGEQVPGRELAEAEWINTMRALVSSLNLAACATGAHEPAPLPPLPVGAEWALESYLSVSEEMTGPARHPAEAEVYRLDLAADPPL